MSIAIIVIVTCVCSVILVYFVTNNTDTNKKKTFVVPTICVDGNCTVESNKTYVV